MADINKLVSDAAVRQIEKLRQEVDNVVASIAAINQSGAALEKQLSGNLGWAKTIGKMREIKMNGELLDVAYKKLVAANDLLQAAETRHANRLEKLAEQIRTQTLLNEKLIIANSKVNKTYADGTTAINARQAAELKAQQTASQGIAVNQRAILSGKAATATMQQQIVTIEALKLENAQLIAQRNALDISTVEGAAAVQALNVGIAENTALIAANTVANQQNAVGIAAVGRGLTRGLGFLRTLAYVLPGIGIAGIFNIVIEAVSSLVTGVSKATGAQKYFNEAMIEAGKSSAIETWQLDRLYKKTQDTTLSIEARKGAVDKLQELFPAYFKNIKDEIILNGGAKDTYELLRVSIIATAKAKALENGITKIYSDDMEKEIRLKNMLTKATTAEMLERGKVIKTAKVVGRADTYKEEIMDAETADALRIERKAIAQKELNDFHATQDAKVKVLADSLDQQQKLIDDRGKPKHEPKPSKTPRGPADLTDNSTTAYIQAARAIFMANYELMKEDSESQEAIAKKSMEFERQSYAVKEKALHDYYAYKQNLADLDETKELNELDLKNQEILAKMERMRTKLNKKGTTDYNSEVLRKELAAQQVLYDENEKTITVTKEKYSKQRVGLAGLEKEAILKMVYETNKWTKAFNEQAAKESLDLVQQNLDALAKMTDEDDTTEATREAFAKKMKYLNIYLELLKTANTIMMGAADALYAHEKGLIDKREQDLKDGYDEDKKRIEASYTNKVDKERELLKLDARKEALQKQIDKDRRAAARKQAQIQKATDISSIIGSTYVAVMAALGAKPYTFANIAIAAGIGATGAANLAKVIATPLPAYAQGTDDHAGGYAVVGDGGKRELVMEPGKKPWVTSNIPTLVDLPAHTKVLPDAQLALPLYQAGLLNMFSGKAFNTAAMATAMVGAFEDKLDVLIAETKKNKSVTNVSLVDFSAHNLHVSKNRR